MIRMIRASKTFSAAAMVALTFPLAAHAMSPRPEGSPVAGLRLEEAGRQDGARLVSLELDAPGVAAIQVDLRWNGAGAAEVTTAPADSAVRAAKFVEGGWQPRGTFRVVVAGPNRSVLDPGQLAVLSLRTAAPLAAGDLSIVSAFAVDPDGRGVDLATTVSSAAVKPADLEPSADVVLGYFAIMPGATGKQTVTIGSHDNANPAAVQIDLLFDPSALTLRSIDAGSASTVSSKQVRWSFVSPSVARIVVQGLNTTPIPDGELIRINWQANSSVPRGTPTSLDCASTVVTNGTGFIIPTTCWGGAVGYIGNRICDVNFDSRVDVGDVQAAINKVVKLSGPAVDVNCNGREDVQDIQQITDGALGLPCPTPGANSCQ